MQTILVANPKGGSGKTTLATNIAGWLAGKRQRVGLLDADPQQSSTQWLARRPALFPSVAGFARDVGKKELKDVGPEWLVIDSPAGLHGEDLRDAVWMPAHLQFSNGGEVVGLVPTRYPDTELATGDLLALARRTEWRERPDGSFVGLGQRVLATDTTEWALMDLRTVTIDAAA